MTAINVIMNHVLLIFFFIYKIYIYIYKFSKIPVCSFKNISVEANQTHVCDNDRKQLTRCGRKPSPLLTP